MNNNFQGQVDFMASRFRDAMVGFEKMNEEFKNVKLRIDFLSPNADKLRQNHEDLSSSVESIRSNLDSQGSSFKMQRDGFNLSITALKERDDQLKNDLEELNKIQYSLKESLKNLANSLANYARSDAIEPLKENIQALSVGTKISLDSLSTISQKLSSDMQIVIKSLSLFESRLDVLEKGYVIHDALFDKVGVRLESEAKSLKNAIDTNRVDLENLIEKKIDSIPKPVISSLDEAKASMKDQIDPISLDASNANIRSRNNEIKISLLEKKVEHLQLLVTKLQLQE